MNAEQLLMTVVCQQLTLQPERRSYSQDQRQSSAAESPPPAGTQRRVTFIHSWNRRPKLREKSTTSQHLQASVSTLEGKVHDMTARKETE